MPESQDSVVCTICGEPTDLDIDRYTDGHGKPLHERCYVNKAVENGRKLPQLADFG